MSNGKGMTPKKGYNQKNWDSNFDLIDWGRKPKEKPWLREVLDDAKKAKSEWPDWAKSDQSILNQSKFKDLHFGDSQ